MHSVSYLGAILPARAQAYAAQTNVVEATRNLSPDTLLPGASLLPASVGRLLTLKNAFVGAAVVVGGYMAWSLFTAPPRKPRASVTATSSRTTAPASTAAAVAGLFGRHYRRRRR